MKRQWWRDYRNRSFDRNVTSDRHKFAFEAMLMGLGVRLNECDDDATDELVELVEGVTPDSQSRVRSR